MENKKLNNDFYWLTQPTDTSEYENDGGILKNMDFAVSGDKNFSYIYYNGGAKMIDNIVGLNYTDRGYISTIISTIPSIGLMFIDSHNRNIQDSGFFHINREFILSFEEIQNQEKEIIDLSKCKDYFRFARNATGLIGRTITNVIDRKKAFPMITKNGSLFNLNFIGSDGNKNTIQLFVENEYVSLLRVFLNTYYKKELPEEAKIPASDSLCYIATACYGDIYAEEVILLRKFRDDYLKHNFLGKFFIALYYKSSNYLYQPLLNSPKVSKIVKSLLDKIVKIITNKLYN